MDGGLGSLQKCFNAAVGAVADPAGDAERFRALPESLSIAHALHSSSDHQA
jgi:hypothetical protein